MGSNISILTHRDHSQIAEAIGLILQNSSFNVFIGPHQCGTFKRYNSTQHYVQRSAACNIILMSKEMFQQERRHVEIFGTAIQNEWDNIFVISMDDQWPFIDHEIIKNLKRLSFHSHGIESSLENSTSLAESILHAIDVRKDKKSHFSHEHFLSLLTEMFGECEVIDRVDNPAMGVNLSLCRCQHPSSGQSGNYILDLATLMGDTGFSKEIRHERQYHQPHVPRRSQGAGALGSLALAQWCDLPSLRFGSRPQDGRQDAGWHVPL